MVARVGAHGDRFARVPGRLQMRVQGENRARLGGHPCFGDTNRAPRTAGTLPWARFCSPGNTSRRFEGDGGPAHTKAPEGTGGRTGQSSRNSSEQVRSRCAPPGTLARWPCGHRTRFPGPSRGSLPGAVWRFAPAPSGRTKCTFRDATATTALSTNFPRITGLLSPTFPAMWTECGRPHSQHPRSVRPA